MKLKLPFRKEKKKPVKKESQLELVFRRLSEARKGMEEEKVKSVIMGIGNDLKGDDGIGWYVIDRLEKGLGRKANLRFIRASVPENHVSEVRDFYPDVVIIIDSADFKGRPGDIRLIGEDEVAENLGGTHTTPITLFLKLLIGDSEFPQPKIVLVGIQKRQTSFGTPISEEVRKAGEKVAKLIERLYRGKILEDAIESEIRMLTSRSPLKRLPGIVDRLAESGRAKKK
jgi:hydrogenase 3 maturation protease